MPEANDPIIRGLLICLGLDVAALVLIGMSIAREPGRYGPFFWSGMGLLGMSFPYHWKLTHPPSSPEEEAAVRRARGAD